MYCPRCSQQQISDETKFCSRCGFPLGLISEIIAHGGFLPQLAELHKDKKLLTRRNGLIFSLFWFLIFVFILTPLFGIAGVEELAGVMAILGTMGGFILMLASFTVLKKPQPLLDFPHQNMETAGGIKNLYQKNQAALPPQQSIPVSTYVPPQQQGSWRDTNDLIPSVTEGTTKLLEKDEER